MDALILRDRDADNNSSTGNWGLEERLYVQQDANYNVTALIETDGDAAERFVYDPFGSPGAMPAAFGRACEDSIQQWESLLPRETPKPTMLMCAKGPSESIANHYLCIAKNCESRSLACPPKCGGHGSAPGDR